MAKPLRHPQVARQRAKSAKSIESSIGNQAEAAPHLESPAARRRETRIWRRRSGGTKDAAACRAESLAPARATKELERRAVNRAWHSKRRLSGSHLAIEISAIGRLMAAPIAHREELHGRASMLPGPEIRPRIVASGTERMHGEPKVEAPWQMLKSLSKPGGRADRSA